MSPSWRSTLEPVIGPRLARTRWAQSARGAPVLENSCHLAYIRAMRRDEVLARLKEAEPALRGFGVGALYLFGSHARDEAKADSDLDVCPSWMRIKPSKRPLAKASRPVTRPATACRLTFWPMSNGRPCGFFDGC